MTGVLLIVIQWKQSCIIAGVSVSRMEKCVATLLTFILYCSYANELGAFLLVSQSNYLSLNGIENAQIY